MKKTILYISIYLFAALTVKAQQYPLYTQSAFNNFGINPAFAGSESCIDFRAGYRMQWAGFEGRPGTAFINGNGKIKPKLLNGKDWFMGVGARIINDEAGPYSSFRMELAWSIHVQLSKSLYGSFGIYAGILQSKFSPDGLVFGNVTPPGVPVGTPDPVGRTATSEILFPTITPGFLVYGKDFFVGLSIQDIVVLFTPDVGAFTNISTHYIFKTAKNFKLSERSDLIPSIIFRGVKGAPFNYEINMMYSLDKDYQIGIAYRNLSAVAALLKLRLFGSLTLGFSYDYPINTLKQGTSGSYEIIIGFNSCDLGKNKNVRCAAFN
jgi:type IX secretion system PorP/SprF family membrane protein